MGKKTEQHSNGAAVRAWAVEQNITEGHGKRGRLSAGLIEQFNTAHPEATYAASTGGKTTPVKITLTNKAGKPYTRSIDVPSGELRELSGATSTRGRLSAAQLQTASEKLSARMQAEKATPQA